MPNLKRPLDKISPPPSQAPSLPPIDAPTLSNAAGPSKVAERGDDGATTVRDERPPAKKAKKRKVPGKKAPYSRSFPSLSHPSHPLIPLSSLIDILPPPSLPLIARLTLQLNTIVHITNNANFKAQLIPVPRHRSPRTAAGNRAVDMKMEEDSGREEDVLNGVEGSGRVGEGGRRGRGGPDTEGVVITKEGQDDAASNLQEDPSRPSFPAAPGGDLGARIPIETGVLALAPASPSYFNPSASSVSTFTQLGSSTSEPQHTNHPGGGFPAPCTEILIKPDQVVKIVKHITQTRTSTLYEVELGSMQRGSMQRGSMEGDRLQFVREEGVPNMALKLIEWSPSPPAELDSKRSKASKAVDSLEREFDMSKLFMSKNPQATLATTVPIYCYGHGGYQSIEDAQAEAGWLGQESVRLILMPLHLPLDDLLKDPSLPEDQKIALFRSGYDKITRFHQAFNFCHRDIKAGNAVVRAQRDERTGELVPVEPKELLLIDCGDAVVTGRPLRFCSRTGTACVSSIMVIESWFYQFFVTTSVKNPLIVTPDKWEVTGWDTTPRWQRGQAERFKVQLGEDLLHPVSEADDLWAWGMCILHHLDAPYFNKVAFPESKYDAFCKNFPGPGRTPQDYQTALRMWADLRNHYVPIYDEKTYRLEKDKHGVQISEGRVEEEWWVLLERLLCRPCIAHAHSSTPYRNSPTVIQKQWNLLDPSASPHAIAHCRCSTTRGVHDKGDTMARTPKLSRLRLERTKG